MAEPEVLPKPSEALYDRCNKEASKSDEGFKKTFTQEDLISFCDAPPLDHVKDVKTLRPVLEELTGSMLFITLKSKSGLWWSLRPRDAAEKVRGLSEDEKMVYETIEAAYEVGIWQRNIKNRTNIKDLKTMERIIHKLQTMCLVKNVKTVRAPLHKTFMLYHLAPSDEVTGGSFYDAGDLDESLVDELSNLIVFHVRQMSWVEEKKRMKRERSPTLIRDDQTGPGARDKSPRKKRKRDPTSTSQSKDIEDAAPPRKQHRSHHSETVYTQISYPPGHTYPTAASIQAYITSNNIIRAVKAASLTVDEIQNVLNVLVWDGKLEEVCGGYRTVRGVKFRHPAEEAENEGEEMERKRGNAMTEMPCGRCPVIDLCGDGGPVNAASCVYFDEWLNQKSVAV